MKRIYQRLKTNASPFEITTKIFLAGAVTFMAAIPAAVSQELVFKNPSLIGGIAGQDKAVYLFPSVTSRIDAHVKIKDRSDSNVIIKNIVVKEFGSHNPVKLISFTAKGMNNDKVVLNWKTSREKNSSHFTIEKSLNGKDFSDAGIVFSIGDSELPQQYSFIDKLRAGEKGLIHYRLKMVDIDQKSQHSPIKVVRIGDENEAMSILVYPNPVGNELRVTLPAEWHKKQVTIDIITVKGLLIKRFVTKNASETETVDMRDVAPGRYIVRSSAASDSAFQPIVKVRHQ